MIMLYDNMKLSYIGSGYVGQVNAVGNAKFGHDVWLVDVIKEKVEMLNQGKPTIFEVGLEELVYDLVKKQKNLQATTDFNAAIQATEVSFICVGTPDKGEMIDLSYIRQAAINIGTALKNKKDFHVVIVKSTVVPGTTLTVVKPLLEEYSGKKAGVDFGLGMNPEFLREGVALNDCINPDSIVIGADDEKTREIMTKIYHWAPPSKFSFVGISAAETIKYAKNTFLALKITFANEWANLCEKLGVDVKEVMQAIGLDKRVGPLFLRAGPGYGGSCFPKDVNAILAKGVEMHAPIQVLETVVKMNNRQYLRMIDIAEQIVGKIDGKKVAVLGLAFKPDTDDTRESPALKLINYLDSRGCSITAYCPQGMRMGKEWLDKNRITIKYAKSKEECVEGAEIVFVPTDWPEFKPLITQLTVPTIVGHRDFVDPKDYPHIYCIGYKK